VESHANARGRYKVKDHKGETMDHDKLAAAKAKETGMPHHLPESPKAKKSIQEKPKAKQEEKKEVKK